jgi:hypothetical protein
MTPNELDELPLTQKSKKKSPNKKQGGLQLPPVPKRAALQLG